MSEPTKPEPEYSEDGPTWIVHEHQRSEELGTVTVYMVVDMDYDTERLLGKCIAECSCFQDAHDVADALNRLQR